MSVSGEIMGRLMWVRTIVQDTATYADRLSSYHDVDTKDTLAEIDRLLAAANVGVWHTDGHPCGEFVWDGCYDCEERKP